MIVLFSLRLRQGCSHVVVFSQWCSFGCLDEGLKGVCLHTLRNGQTEWNLNTPGAPEDERGWEEIDDGKRTAAGNAIIQYFFWLVMRNRR